MGQGKSKVHPSTVHGQPVGSKRTSAITPSDLEPEQSSSGNFDGLRAGFLDRKNSGLYSNHQIFLDLLENYERQKAQAKRQSGNGRNRKRRGSTGLVQTEKREVHMLRRKSFSNDTSSFRQAFRLRCIKATDVIGASEPELKLADIDLEVLTFLRTAMRNLFSHNSELFDSLKDIALNMKRRELNKGDVLIKQGDTADEMFVVFRGCFSCNIDNVEVGDVKDGDVVGELALTYDVKRQATVTATTSSVVYSLDRIRFQKLQARQYFHSRARIANFLRQSSAFSKLDPFSILKVADAMKLVHFADGESLLSEGQATGACLLLNAGRVVVTSVASERAQLEALFPHHAAVQASAPPSMVCAEGCFLGEPVLLSAASRAPQWTTLQSSTTVLPTVTARAEGAVSCWSIDLGLFHSLFGPVNVVLEQGVTLSFGCESSRRPTADERQPGPPMSIEDFTTIAHLGEGSFGRVVLAEVTNKARSDCGQRFAVKQMGKEVLQRTANIQHINDERDLLQTVDHPFVLKLHASFADRDSLYLVTSYVPAVSMWQLVYREKVLSTTSPFERGQIARFWTACLAESIRYLHAGGIAYRDLKPENVLLDAQGYVILIDLGFAKKLPYSVTVDGNEELHDRTYTLCGTIEYLAPEFLFSGRGHDHAVDVWAFGCLLFELVWGHTPFVENSRDRDMPAILKRICMTKWRAFECPIDFDRRIACERGEPIASCRNLVEGLLVCDTTKRLGNQQHGLQALLDHDFFAGIHWEQLVCKSLDAPWRPNSRLLDAHSGHEFGDEAPPIAEFTGDNSLFASW